MFVSAGEVQSIMGCNKEVASLYTPHLNQKMVKWGIDTKARVAMFLAQIGHESNRLRSVVENLNYSSKALRSTWPSRYTKELADLHHRKPEVIANHVYGGRMGNVREGDGWKYRGRGLIQLTGYDNYKAFEITTGIPATVRPDLLERPEHAVEAACWYWKENNLNRWTDREDLVGVTRAINGGLNGLKDREALFKKASSVLSWS